MSTLNQPLSFPLEPDDAIRFIRAERTIKVVASMAGLVALVVGMLALQTAMYSGTPAPGEHPALQYPVPTVSPPSGPSPGDKFFD